MALEDHIDAYVQYNHPNQNFNGTEAGWTQYKQEWVNDCTVFNQNKTVTGVRRKSKAAGLCNKAFNDATGDYQNAVYALDAENLAAVKANNAKLQNTAIASLVVVALIGLIVWLLTSK